MALVSTDEQLFHLPDGSHIVVEIADYFNGGTAINRVTLVSADGTETEALLEGFNG